MAQGMSTAQRRITAKRTQKADSAVYSLVRKVIAPCKKIVRIKLSGKERVRPRGAGHARRGRESTYILNKLVDFEHAFLAALLGPRHHIDVRFVVLVRLGGGLNFARVELHLGHLSCGERESEARSEHLPRER